MPDQINVLAAEFSDLARNLQARADPDAVLAEVVAAAVRLVPGTEDGSITAVSGRHRVSALHPSSDLPRLIDAEQERLGEGPCLDAVYEHQSVRVTDMRSEHRWPRFARAATDLGVFSMLSFQLYVNEDNLGALNLFARQPEAFDEESEHVGLLFASHVAVAYAEARHVDQLHRSITTRDLIGQAKGVLMERFSLDAEQAFRVLSRISQNRNARLRDIAEELLTTRQLPELTPPPPH